MLLLKNMLKKELIKLTSKLVKIDSSNTVGKKAIVNFVRDFFAEEKVFIKVFSRNNYPTIVISLQKGKFSNLILSGHLDVVPATAKEFNPVIKQGKIFGRGTGDMKSACAVMIIALRDFSRLPKKPSVSLILTTDEEIGGHSGTEYLLKKEKYRSHLAIVPDGGTELKTIIINKKGVLQLKLKSFGKSAHGSRPFWGDNAIDKLIKEYSKIRLLVPELKTRKWKTTMNLGIIRGGDVANKVPDYAEMCLDIRYLSITEKDNLIKKIKRISPKLEIINIGQPFYQNPKHPLIQLYKKVSADVLREKIKFSRMEGSSDARFFSEMGIPTIITRIDSKNIHSLNEYVNLRAMEKFYEILLKFIPKVENFLKIL